MATRNGERSERRRWREERAERVAAVGRKQVCFVRRSFRRAPQQDSLFKRESNADLTRNGLVCVAVREWTATKVSLRPAVASNTPPACCILIVRVRSYLTDKEKTTRMGGFFFMATRNGLEPSTSSVTGWRANRLHHRAKWWNGLNYNRRFVICKDLFFR